MTVPEETRNPLVVLGTLMLVGLGGFILLAGLVAGGGNLPASLVGAALIAAGLVLFAVGRGDGDAPPGDEEERA